MGVDYVGPGRDPEQTAWGRGNAGVRSGSIAQKKQKQLLAAKGSVFVPSYWCFTVFPMSANLRSSKMRNLCCSASACSFWLKASVKSCRQRHGSVRSTAGAIFFLLLLFLSLLLLGDVFGFQAKPPECPRGSSAGKCSVLRSRPAGGAPRCWSRRPTDRG